MHSDIIKDSSTLKQALLDRWQEIGITHVVVVSDAKSRGINGITTNAISKWIHNSYQKAALNQYQILWLSYRYDIPVRLHIGEPYLQEDKIKYIVSKPYNEARALKRLDEMFPFVEAVQKIIEKIPVKKKRKPRKKK